jgi:Protein of unknown function (DUF2889)
MTLLAPPPADPAPAPPARRPGSVRRTSTMLMFWPHGLGTDLHLKGRARDLRTSPRGEPEVLRSTDLSAVTGRERDIRSIEAEPDVPGLEQLVGCRGGGNLRLSIANNLSDEVRRGTPLHLLLDDMAGSTLIAGFAFFRWKEVIPEMRERLDNAPRHVMLGICSGFRQGSSALEADGTLKAISQNTAIPPSLADPGDPFSWHELDPHPAIAMRRARRIDVWVEDDTIGIDAMFRDSCWSPEGNEEVVHEYQILGSADRSTGTVLTLTALPRVLPYAECPGAAPHAAWLIGTELQNLRSVVLERLKSTDCCTHLNDGLRSLAEAPVLASFLAG